MNSRLSVLEFRLLRPPFFTASDVCPLDTDID